MDEPDDFRLIEDYYNQVNIALYQIGDLVQYIGYHYSPDYIYIDREDFNMGIVAQVLGRYTYQPIYRVFWFKKGLTTEVAQDHLRLVVIEKQD